jgi:hypothetical protein
VLGGVYTDVEKTMIEIYAARSSRRPDNAFQNAMQDRFIKAIEELPGRNVLAADWIPMSAPQQKVPQYLTEAHSHELALVRVLQSQIAMTPSGPYRSALDEHLEETRGHARRVAERLGELDDGSHPLMAVVGFWEDMLGQAVALGRTPV